jgi:ABC-type uncharacterized transport system permease subunit
MILLHVLAALAYALAAWTCWPRQPAEPRAAARAQLLVPLGLALHAAAIGVSLVTPEGIDLSLPHALSLVAALTVLVAWSSGLLRALPAIGAVVLPVAAIAVLLPALTQDPRRFAYASEPWATVHIAFALLAYAFFIVAAALALALTGLERRLHHGLADPDLGAGASPPPLLTLERWMFALIGAGFALLTLTLASGALFSEELFGIAFRFNHKVIFSVAAWLVFGALLLGRWRLGWRGRRALRWILVGTGLLILAYIGYKFVLEVVLGR